MHMVTTHSDAGTSTGDAPAPLGFEPNVFHAVALEVAGPSARIYVDGLLAGAVATGLVSAPIRATLTVGPHGKEGPSPDWALLYDDVICEKAN
jgi:hypothetical protein